MRRRWLLLCAAATAQHHHRESLRHREKRHERALRELDPHDRAQITEMHAQGLRPHHIASELGLPGGAHVDTAIDALGLRARRPSTGARRHKTPQNQAPSITPADRARAYRARKRARKKGEL